MSAARVVIGVDAGLTSERQGEHALAAVAAALARHGVQGEWLATHRAATRDGVHVALSLALYGAVIHAGQVADVVRQALDDPDAAIADDDETAGPAGRVGAATFARSSFVTRSEGRAVRFPGCAGLVGTVRLGDVMSGTAVDRVQALAGAQLRADDLLRTREFVRPRFERGDVVLHVQPADGGVFVPFESPNPTPCCADHRR